MTILSYDFSKLFETSLNIINTKECQVRNARFNWYQNCGPENYQSSIRKLGNEKRTKQIETIHNQTRTNCSVYKTAYLANSVKTLLNIWKNPPILEKVKQKIFTVKVKWNYLPKTVYADVTALMKNKME